MSAGTTKPQIRLASTSPRRCQLLRDAGFTVAVHAPGIDDGMLDAGSRHPSSWVMAMAHLKVRWVAGELQSSASRVRGPVLGADTVCVKDGVICGKPGNVEDARRMLRSFCSSVHRVYTGVCLLEAGQSTRTIFHDHADLVWGSLTDTVIEEYLESGKWQGCAGAYNLQERIDDGWPIRCKGDPTTVIGLPMLRLVPLLKGALFHGDSP